MFSSDSSTTPVAPVLRSDPMISWLIFRIEIRSFQSFTPGCAGLREQLSASISTDWIRKDIPFTEHTFISHSIGDQLVTSPDNGAHGGRIVSLETKYEIFKYHGMTC